MLATVVPKLHQYCDQLAVRLGPLGATAGAGATDDCVYPCQLAWSLLLLYLQGARPTRGQLQVRAALTVALGRCMLWNGGSEAPAIIRAAKGTWLEDSLHAVQPAVLAFL